MRFVSVNPNTLPLHPVFGRLLDGAFDAMLDNAAQARAAAARAPAPEAEPARRPALDVAETSEAWLATLDLPGVRREDVRVSIDGRRVQVEAGAVTDTATPAGAEAATAQDTPRVLLRERAAPRYARSFQLPAEVDESASEARFVDGVLTLTLAKRRPLAARHLTIN